MIKPNIVRLNIQLTKKCNQRCKSYNSYKLKTDDEISLDDFKSVINQVTNLFDIKNIAFTGGEPTTYPHILEIARHAKSKSKNVSITTNGFYFTSKSRVKDLIDSGINRFSFSYHGVGIHDEFTGTSGAEKRLRQAVDWVLSYKDDYPIYVKVGTLFTGDNINEVEKVLNYAQSKNVDLYIEIFDDQIPVFKNSHLSDNQKRSKISYNDLKNAVESIRLWASEKMKGGGYFS